MKFGALSCNLGFLYAAASVRGSAPLRQSAGGAQCHIAPLGIEESSRSAQRRNGLLCRRIPAIPRDRASSPALRSVIRVHQSTFGGYCIEGNGPWDHAWPDRPNRPGQTYSTNQDIADRLMDGGRSIRFHLCKTCDYWTSEAIIAFEQPCARNRRLWRGIAAECKRRSRVAARRSANDAGVDAPEVGHVSALKTWIAAKTNRGSNPSQEGDWSLEGIDGPMDASRAGAAC